MALYARHFCRASSIKELVRACVSIDPSRKIQCSHTASRARLSRSLSTTHVPRSTEEPGESEGEGGAREAQHAHGSNGGKLKKYVIHPVETSIRYMKSNAYKRAYGEQPVWVPYRRNFKGQFPPETREQCVRRGHITTGSPCPICRDEYLVVHHQNTALLEQFISPTTGEIIKTKKTGVCQKVHFNIELEILKAYDFGTLRFEVPFRSYNLSDFYPQLGGIQGGGNRSNNV